MSGHSSVPFLCQGRLSKREGHWQPRTWRPASAELVRKPSFITPVDVKPSPVTLERSCPVIGSTVQTFCYKSACLAQSCVSKGFKTIHLCFTMSLSQKLHLEAYRLGLNMSALVVWLPLVQQTMLDLCIFDLAAYSSWLNLKSLTCNAGKILCSWTPGVIYLGSFVWSLIPTLLSLYMPSAEVVIAFASVNSLQSAFISPVCGVVWKTKHMSEK